MSDIDSFQQRAFLIERRATETMRRAEAEIIEARKQIQRVENLLLKLARTAPPAEMLP